LPLIAVYDPNIHRKSFVLNYGLVFIFNYRQFQLNQITNRNILAFYYIWTDIRVDAAYVTEHSPGKKPTSRLSFLGRGCNRKQTYYFGLTPLRLISQLFASSDTHGWLTCNITLISSGALEMVKKMIPFFLTSGFTCICR